MALDAGAAGWLEREQEQAGPLERPHDSPDLAWVMSFVTSVGGVAAWWTRGSVLGLASGLGVGATFALGGWWIQGQEELLHEAAHQACLIGSVLFGGAMSYRAGFNPYVGPGGTMLAALGAASSAAHLRKSIEWRAYEMGRVAEAERLLREYKEAHPDPPPPLPEAAAGKRRSWALGRLMRRLRRTEEEQ